MAIEVRTRLARALLAACAVAAAAGCGEGGFAPSGVEGYQIDAFGNFSITDYRPQARQLTSDDFGTGFPATYRQAEGGKLIIRGDGTGMLYRYRFAHCQGPVERWIELTGPVEFAEAGVYHTLLYSLDGALVISFVYPGSFEFAPYEVSFPNCEPYGEWIAPKVSND